MTWLRVLAVFVAILAVAVAGAGCGSDAEGGSSSEAKALLEQALAGTKAVDSGELQLEMKADVDGIDSLDGPLALRLAGPFKSNGKGKLPSLDWDITFDGAGQKLLGGVVATPTNAFLRFQGRSFELGEKTFADLTGRLELKESGQPLSPGQLGLNPTSWIEDPKVEDGDAIGGDETRKVTGSVNVRKVVKDAMDVLESPTVRKPLKREGAADADIPEPSEKDLKEIEDAVDDANVEVNVDKQDVLRRFFMEIDLNAEHGGGGDKDLKGKLSFTYLLSKVGGNPTISAPKDARPLSELLSGLGLFSALGGKQESGSLPDAFDDKR